METKKWGERDEDTASKPKSDLVRRVRQALDPMHDILKCPAPSLLGEERPANLRKQRELISSLKNHAPYISPNAAYAALLRR